MTPSKYNGDVYVSPVLEGIARTQRWLKGVHRSLYERQLSRLQQGSCRPRSSTMPLLNRSQLKQPLAASCN